MNLVTATRAKYLGEKVTEYREMREMTVEELASKCGFKASKIESIERGEQALSMGTVKKIAEALELSEGAFFITGMENAEEFMRTLFEIETKYGLYPDCTPNGIFLRFEETYWFKLLIKPLLKEWSCARKNPNPLDYIKWKAEFTPNDRVVKELKERNKQLTADNNYLLNRVKELEKQLKAAKDEGLVIAEDSEVDLDDSAPFKPASEEENDVFAELMNIPVGKELEIKPEKAKRGRPKKKEENDDEMGGITISF